jgi:hypothetical protein
MSEKDSRQRGGLVGPIILIGLGIIFLLNNLGLLSWSIWGTLLRMWPILLVAAGLDLILGRRSVWGSLLALVLTLAIFGAALWLSGTDVGIGRQMRSEEIIQSREEAEEAQIVVDPGVGTLRIEAASDSTTSLVEGTARVARGEELTRSFTVEDDRGTFLLRTQTGSFGPFATGWGGQRLWELRLSPEVPLRLETNLGLGETTLDLTGLTVDRIDVEQGLGQARITFPEEGRFEARVEGAIGQTILVIPEALAAQIRLDTGISGRQIPDDYRCEEDVCTSPDYGTADHRVDLEVSQAIGNVAITH